MKFRAALMGAGAMAALPLAAEAQPISGVYLGANLGYNMMSDQTLKNVPGQPDLRFHGGYVGDAHAGYGFGDGLRVELEATYANNQVNDLRGAGIANASGNEAKYGVMANVLYDIDVGLPFFTPYVGGGAGVQWVDLKGVHANSIGLSADHFQSAFAYQGIAGFSTPVPGVEGLSTDFEYRYMATAGSRDYDGAIGGAPSRVKIGRDANNQFTLGLRFALGQEAPPAAPVPVPVPISAPAPAPVKSFLVFFDWNKADLTPRAAQIVAQAASASRTAQTTRLDVSGYTDTSGTPSYNRKLSLKRADVVAEQLVSDGVAKAQIEIHAYGETHLLVPTGPGVREPQNRRVEIVLN